MNAQEQQAPKPNGWPAGRTCRLNGVDVELSAPVLIGRSKQEFWYPQILRAPGGEIVAMIRAGGDHLYEDDWFVMWASSGGLQWSAPERVPGQSEGQVLLDSGEFALLPFHHGLSAEGVKGPLSMLDPRRRTVRRVESGVTVTGFPRRVGRMTWEKTVPGQDACLLFDGQPVRLKDGSYLAPAYGSLGGDHASYKNTLLYDEDGKLKRYSLLALESANGADWRYRSTVADETCPLRGNECADRVFMPGKEEHIRKTIIGDEGPCEGTFCRLKDGRIMCVFRLHGCGYFAPYGHCFSSDEGKTWSVPQPMPKGMRSVLPRMARLDDGTLLLSGGRPDVFLWIDLAGNGREWHQVDLLEHHNACHSQEPIRRLADTGSGTYGYGSTTAYTQMAVVDKSTVLLVYDRTPLTFPQPPADSADPRETYSCWVVRARIAK